MSDEKVTRVSAPWLSVAGFVVVIITTVVTVTNILATRLVTLETRMPMLESSLSALIAQNSIQQIAIEELKLGNARMGGDVAMIRAFVERMERRMDATPMAPHGVRREP